MLWDVEDLSLPIWSASIDSPLVNAVAGYGPELAVATRDGSVRLVRHLPLTLASMTTALISQPDSFPLQQDSMHGRFILVCVFFFFFFFFFFF